MSRAEVEDFLYREAALLDEWRLAEWLELMTEDCLYEIPALDCPESDAGRTFSLIHDNRVFLEQRVARLLKPTAHAEFPHSRTRRIVGNVRILGTHDPEVMITANFAVHRVDLYSHVEYVGRYEHVLVTGPDGFRIKHRKAILDHQSLQPHGKVSILL
ncbi:MAG TPA: aromatic-ring-hydroxylating dioxygenase subunit beta [Pseudonocardia sp.]